MATTLLQRKQASAWTSFVEDHRANAASLTDATAKTLTDYCIANFNTDVPPYNIPPALLAGEIITPF